jgi:PiT family inorganic phosphate transporter
MWEIALLFSALFLAYFNGANDNFKGVATLYGSGTTDYKRALLLATMSTFLGSVAALVVAQELLAAFTGKGLVPNELIHAPAFALAVGLGAAGTIFIATYLGFPVSTTHALIGALSGIGFASGSLNFARLGSTFLLPLLLSPLLAMAAAMTLSPLLQKIKQRLGSSGEICLCLKRGVVPMVYDRQKVAVLSSEAHIEIGDAARCEREYADPLLTINTELLTDIIHYISSILVGFARGLNDTPKIAAILLMAGTVPVAPGMAIVGVAVFMALGGLLAARKVAEKMSKGVTSLDTNQGVSANLVTSILVLGASHIGVPVSTTHVSCGSLFGIGWVSGKGHWKTIASIGAAWVITLPTAALLSVLVYWCVGSV